MTTWSRRREVAQRPADDLLAHALRVHVGGVEEGDAELERPPDERPAVLFVQHPRAPGRRAVGHRAEAQPRDLQARSSEIEMLHGFYDAGWRRRRSPRGGRRGAATTRRRSFAPAGDRRTGARRPRSSRRNRACPPGRRRSGGRGGDRCRPPSGSLRRLSNTCSVCDSTSRPASCPVAGSMAPCPDTNTRRSNTTAGRVRADRLRQPLGLHGPLSGRLLHRRLPETREAGTQAA